MLICLELLFAITPLGYIPVGGIRATTMHLPVILAAVLFGYRCGALLGLVFGITSILINTFQPTPFSFIFSPFYSLGAVTGGLPSLLIALLPRIMIGVNAAFVFKHCKNQTAGLALSGVIGSFTSTILVLLGIYIFFKEPYAATRNISSDLVAGVLISQLCFNGALEAIIACISTTVIGKVLLRLVPKN